MSSDNKGWTPPIPIVVCPRRNYALWNQIKGHFRAFPFRRGSKPWPHPWHQRPSMRGEQPSSARRLVKVTNTKWGDRGDFIFSHWQHWWVDFCRLDLLSVSSILSYFVHIKMSCFVWKGKKELCKGVYMLWDIALLPLCGGLTTQTLKIA
jgi:hypothetical protein